MNIDSKLYKIIRGRFRVNVSGLLFLFTEPTANLIADSYEIYEEAYEQAYSENCYIRSELDQMLISEDIWSPFFEKQLKDLYNRVEDLKIEAFETFFDTRTMNSKKRQIQVVESEIEELLQRKHKMDSLCCENVAEEARWFWLIKQCVTPNDKLDASQLLQLYRDNSLAQKEIREIARYDAWRQIWNASKRNGSLFNKSSIELTQDQLTLVSYSLMYDNIYEHPESPSESIIEDDYCIDGWLILQRRKAEKEKSSKEIDEFIGNSKIKNSQEVFIVAKSAEQAKKVYDLNDNAAKNIIAQRNAAINSQTGLVKDSDLPDVRQKIEIMQSQLIKDKVKGK